MISDWTIYAVDTEDGLLCAECFREHMLENIAHEIYGELVAAAANLGESERLAEWLEENGDPSGWGLDTLRELAGKWGTPIWLDGVLDEAYPGRFPAFPLISVEIDCSYHYDEDEDGPACAYCGRGVYA